MTEVLSGQELQALVGRVFVPREGEKALAILVDLPDARVADNADWKNRRQIALGWHQELQKTGGMDVSLVLYRNAHTNNGDLPDHCWLYENGPLPETAEAMDSAASIPFVDIFNRFPMMLAPTEFSATAPLKMAAKVHMFRAATMPGFSAEMIPALRLDYTEVNRRVDILKNLMDKATGADLRFLHPGGESKLHLDLRFRPGHASGGLIPNRGTAGNLPSGEAYMVPYEGENEASLSAGELPVQFGQEVVRYRIENNRAVEVLSKGPESEREKALLAKEPAYANLAELGLGVLDGFGVKPCGEILLDEKLGLHIAFGRSEHFGGQVGPKQFSSPDAVIHIDRIYVNATQPDVKVQSLDFIMEDASRVSVMRDGAYVVKF